MGENGAIYFRYAEERRVMEWRYWKTAAERAADQAYREADLAIDFCEDVAPLGREAVAAIVECFVRNGAIAKVSSIHVNGWYGDYDKLAMSSRFFAEIFKVDIEKNRRRVLYVGDSPNDAPMFGFFPQSVGVANILNFTGQMEHLPAWVTEKEGGDGFAELTHSLLANLHIGS